MSLGNIGKGALRVAKNYTKGYSDVQAKVRDATSNDPWGPSGTQMNEIAQLTYNQNDFVEIMEMLDKRLNDKGKNWRHVFKALTLLDYCLHAGSENVVIYFRDNVYLVKTLKEFQYVDEYGKDQGANVRQKAKDITNLLQDESRLRQERRSRANMRDRMTKGGTSNDNDEPTVSTSTSTSTNGAAERDKRKAPRKDDEEIKRALEASKQSYEREQLRTAEDADVQRAIQLSEQEASERTKAVEDANSRSLFDDGLQVNAQTNPFPLVDASLQPQYTYVQPQLTSFNPYLQEQQQALMQQQWAQQQAEWAQQQQLAQQQAEWAQQQQLAQQQALQQQQQQQLAQQQALQQQQQYAWLLQQQQQQQTALAPQPTGFGSRNPFALGSTPSPAPPVPAISPTISPPPTNVQQFQNPSPSPALASNPPAVKTRPDENTALAALFANRDGGIDTFGNYGNLRFGNSHAGRLMATNTGAPSGNPFGAQQSTGTDQPFFSV